jgi:hypothetical protein
MEKQVLARLRFDLTVATSYTFLRRFAKCSCAGDESSRVFMLSRVRRAPPVPWSV